MLRSAVALGIAWLLFGACGGSAKDPSVNAEASPISCDWSQFYAGSKNERGIGDGCHEAAQEQACGFTNFCTSRVLDDRWPTSDENQSRSGYCTTHCETAGDCGSGFTCCEARRGPFCTRYAERSEHDYSGCTERCSADELSCASDEICCARMGKICVSVGCSGVCIE